MTSEHPAHLPKKRTMVKDRVGCVRTSTYNLPPEGHVYGHANTFSDEGAGSIISNWVTANPSLEKKTSKMIVASNVLAIKNGCITATSMRQYAIEHPNIRLKEVLSNDSTRVDANHEGPFGIKTKFSEEPIRDILQAKYTDFKNDDADYPTITSIKKVGYMPAPRTTNAEQKKIEARLKSEQKGEPEPFIMKRFRNVKGKYQQDRERAAAERKASQRATAAAATATATATAAAYDAEVNAPNADEPAQSDEDAS